jgi:peptidoglycan/LPS O-acetylase OafA/YrhL
VLPFAPYGVLKPFFSTGADGVSFFFILSGFVLTWSHRHGDTPLAFMRRRIARIYPTQVFTWVVTLVVLTTAYSAPPKLPALANLFLVSTWIPTAAYSQAMNTPSWSLCCELFFYICFPLVLPRLLAMDSAQRRRTLVVITAAIVVLAGALNPVTYASHSFWLLYWFPPVRMLEFVAGMLLAMELADGRLPRVPLWLAGALAALAYVGSGHVPRAFGITSVTFVPFLLLIAAAAQRDVSGRRTFLATRPMVRLGTWSFAFYMVHYTVLRVMVLRMHLFPSALASALFAVAALAVSLAAAALTHRFVEQPWEQLLRSPLRRRRLRSPA